MKVGVLFCCCYFEAGSYYIDQAGFKLTILLPQPPKGWVCKRMNPASSSLLNVSDGQAGVGYTTLSCVDCYMQKFEGNTSSPC
jgi:hypothetical protein